MKKLDNVLLLATSHNISKAYLYKLYQLDLRPSKIVLLKWRNSSYSSKIDSITGVMFNKLQSQIKTTLVSSGYYTGDLSLSPEELLQHLKWEYEVKIIDHINDEELISYISNNNHERIIIYCGGGILRSAILNCGKRFIHIHPGELPFVKGADCLLWSALVQNKIGMSAFFMNDGIDTGDIIDTANYPVPIFEVEFEQLDSKVSKKLLINYVDPHYRAQLLGSLFMRNPDPDDWQTTPQNARDGKRYYFMHEALLLQAVKKFYTSELKIIS